MDANNFIYRILIVEDDLEGWAQPMQRRLKDLMPNCQVDIAEDKVEAEALMAVGQYQFFSFDMRMPEKQGEIVSIETGVALAKRYPWSGFPKYIIYSQTLQPEEIQRNLKDGVMVLRLVVPDIYSKPTGGDQDNELGDVECLRVVEWAERVRDYLCVQSLRLDVGRERKPLSLLGAYLEDGPELLPPIIAIHLRSLQQEWDTREGIKLKYALRLIESVSRLAMMQTSFFLAHQNLAVDLPRREDWAGVLNWLEAQRPHITEWNWSNYMREETIKALDKARRLRNEEAHQLSKSDAKKRWVELQEPLLYALDICCYWVRHPILTDLRYDRDGWSAVHLAGLESLKARKRLPDNLDFPAEATSGGIWQLVWRLPTEGQLLQSCGLSWPESLLSEDAKAEKFWLPMTEKGQNGARIDLLSGIQAN